MANLIVNTSGTDGYGAASAGVRTVTYYTTSAVPYGSGGAIQTTTSQPKVVGGAVMNVSPTNKTAGMSIMDGVSPGRAVGVASYAGSTTYRGTNNGITSAFVSGVTWGVLSATATGGIEFKPTTSQQAAADTSPFVNGTIMYVGPSGTGQVGIASTSGGNALYGIYTVTGSFTHVVVTSHPANSFAVAGTQVCMQALSASYSFSKVNQGQYIIPGMTTKIANVATNVLKTRGNPASANGVDMHRSIKKREAFRTTKILTALRNGQFNRFTGKWATVPTLSNDTGMAGTADKAASVTPRTTTIPAGIVYKSGRAKAFWTADGAVYGVKKT